MDGNSEPTVWRQRQREKQVGPLVLGTKNVALMHDVELSQVESYMKDAV
jgi:hypothetical protein